MAEEIEVLDDEINQICAEVEGKLTKLTTKKKMARKDKEELCEELLERMSRARDVYSTFRVEMREVLKEKGKIEYTRWESKGHEKHKRISALIQQIDVQKRLLASMPVGPEDRDQKDKNTWHASELIDEGKRVQQKSHDSLARSKKLVASAEAIGVESNLALKAQSEQMKATNQDIAEVDQGIRRANTVLRQIGRRIATDKMIMCLILLLILGILGILVAKAANLMPSDGDSEPIDCALDFTQTTKKCLEQEQKAKEAAAGGDQRRHLLGRGRRFPEKHTRLDGNGRRRPSPPAHRSQGKALRADHGRKLAAKQGEGCHGSFCPLSRTQLSPRSLAPDFQLEADQQESLSQQQIRFQQRVRKPERER